MAGIFWKDQERELGSAGLRDFFPKPEVLVKKIIFCTRRLRSPVLDEEKGTCKLDCVGKEEGERRRRIECSSASYKDNQEDGEQARAYACARTHTHMFMRTCACLRLENCFLGFAAGTEHRNACSRHCMQVKSLLLQEAASPLKETQGRPAAVCPGACRQRDVEDRCCNKLKAVPRGEWLCKDCTKNKVM